MKTKVLLFITLLFSFCGFAQETTDATIDKGSGILYFSAKPGTTPSSPDLYSVSEFAMNTAANPPELWVWNRANTAWERQFAITQGTAVPTVAPATGLPRTYIRTTTGAIYVYNGSAWVELGAGGGGGTDDQTAVEVPFSPTGNILSSDVQSMGEELQTQIDGLQTTSGVVNGATNLGTFSGSTISDNTTTKAALQELETAVESSGGGSVDTTIVRPETFGAKADFRRDIAVYVSGDNTVTCATCNFTSADVGDYVALKFATTNASYSNKKIALNTTIASVTNSTTIELADAPTESGTHTMNWGKNNVTNLIAMFDYCNENNIRTVSMSGGTYGYSFKDETFSTENNNRVGALNGMLQKGSITVLGNGSTIKDMWEDQQLPNNSQEKQYSTLLLSQNGTRRFYNLTLESSDRSNTRNSNNNLTGIRTEETQGIQIDVWAENLNIISGSEGHTKGYSYAVYSSGGGTWDDENDIIEDWSEWHLKDCTLEANVQVITYFTNSNDGSARKLHLTDVKTKGGVSVTNGTLTNAVSISSGSNQLTLTNDTLSFYDLREIVGTDVTIDGTFTSTISSIDSRNTITLLSNSPSNFTDVDLEYSSGTNGKFGHVMYIHPNISIDFENVTSTDAGSVGGFALHYFSSGGQVGRTRYFYLKNWSKKSKDGEEMLLDLNTPNLSYNQFDSLQAKISNMPVKLQTGASPKMRFDYVQFIPNVILYNESLITNSTGSIRIEGSNKYTVYNFEGRIKTESSAPSLDCFNCTLDLELANGGDNILMSGGKLTKMTIPSTATDLTKGVILNGSSNENLDRTINGNTNDVTELVKRLKFINTSVGGKELTAWNGQRITGLIPIQNIVDNTPINSLTNIVENPIRQIQTDYAIDYNHLVLKYDANEFNVGLSGYADVLWINELGNINLFNAFPVSTSFFTGTLTLNPVSNSFELRTGGNIRLKNTGVRTQTSRFRLIPESLIFEELDNNRYTSSSIPTRSNAVNNEIVYNTDQTANDKSWSYIIEKTEVVAEAFTPASTTLPYVFTLANIPYRNEREQTFINPAFEITVPRTGGNDILTVGVWGELINQDGDNVGSLNINTGEITLSTLSTGTLTLDDVTVDYEYISSEGWVANGSGSGGGSTQVATISDLISATNFSDGDIVEVLNHTANDQISGKYQIYNSLPVGYPSTLPVRQLTNTQYAIPIKEQVYHIVMFGATPYINESVGSSPDYDAFKFAGTWFADPDVYADQTQKRYISCAAPNGKYVIDPTEMTAPQAILPDNLVWDFGNTEINIDNSATKVYFFLNNADATGVEMYNVNIVSNVDDSHAHDRPESIQFNGSVIPSSNVSFITYNAGIIDSKFENIKTERLYTFFNSDSTTNVVFKDLWFEKNSEDFNVSRPEINIENWNSDRSQANVAGEVPNDGSVGIIHFVYITTMGGDASDPTYFKVNGFNFKGACGLVNRVSGNSDFGTIEWSDGVLENTQYFEATGAEFCNYSNINFYSPAARLLQGGGSRSINFSNIQVKSELTKQQTLISFTDDNTKGSVFNVDNLTIDMPNATVQMYNDTKSRSTKINNLSLDAGLHSSFDFIIMAASATFPTDLSITNSDLYIRSNFADQNLVSVNAGNLTQNANLYVNQLRIEQDASETNRLFLSKDNSSGGFLLYHDISNVYIKGVPLTQFRGNYTSTQYDNIRYSSTFPVSCERLNVNKIYAWDSSDGIYKPLNKLRWKNRNDCISIYEFNTSSNITFKHYNLVDVNGSSLTATVPTNASLGDWFVVSDSEGTASGTNTITVDFSTNGYTVSGSNVINTAGESKKFIYIGSNKWIIE